MSLYTFINGQKIYIIKPKDIPEPEPEPTPEMVTLTVSPTYSAAKVKFNTPGTVSGKSITVEKGTVVSYTLTADKHDDLTATEIVNETKTINPKIKLSHINPTAKYGNGTAYIISEWTNRGQSIIGGTYHYGSDIFKQNTWSVTVDSKGSITNFKVTSGSTTVTGTGGGAGTIKPNGGWNFSDIWE